MADKNIFITPITTGGSTYYFPGTHIYIGLNKTLTELPIPKGEISLDLLYSSRLIRLVGKWKNDRGNEYDGLGSFYRVIRFLLENESSAQVYQFHWSGSWTPTGPRAEEPNVYVKVQSMDFDRAPGEKDVMTYNIVFRKITHTG